MVQELEQPIVDVVQYSNDSNHLAAALHVGHKTWRRNNATQSHQRALVQAVMQRRLYCDGTGSAAVRSAAWALLALAACSDELHTIAEEADCMHAIQAATTAPVGSVAEWCILRTSLTLASEPLLQHAHARGWSVPRCVATIARCGSSSSGAPLAFLSLFALQLPLTIRGSPFLVKPLLRHGLLHAIASCLASEQHLVPFVALTLLEHLITPRHSSLPEPLRSTTSAALQKAVAASKELQVALTTVCGFGSFEDAMQLARRWDVQRAQGELESQLAGVEGDAVRMAARQQLRSLRMCNYCLRVPGLGECFKACGACAAASTAGAVDCTSDDSKAGAGNAGGRAVSCSSKQNDAASTSSGSGIPVGGRGEQTGNACMGSSKGGSVAADAVGGRHGAGRCHAGSGHNPPTSTAASANAGDAACQSAKSTTPCSRGVAAASRTTAQPDTSSDKLGADVNLSSADEESFSGDSSSDGGWFTSGSSGGACSDGEDCSSSSECSDSEAGLWDRHNEKVPTAVYCSKMCQTADRFERHARCALYRGMPLQGEECRVACRLLYVMLLIIYVPGELMCMMGFQ